MATNPYIKNYAKRQRSGFAALNKKPFAAPASTAVKPPDTTPDTDVDISQYDPSVVSGNISQRVAPREETTQNAIIGGSSAGTGMGGPSTTPMIGNPGMQNAKNGLFGLDSSGGQYSVLSQINGIGDDAMRRAESEMAAFRVKNARQRYKDPFEGIVSGAPNMGGGGGGVSAGWDISRAPLAADQKANALKIMQIGKQRGMSDSDIEIAIMTALTESGLRNLNYGDRDSVGLFQQRTSQGWGTIQQIMDPNYSINKFFDAYQPVRGRNLTPWQKAQAVQRSFDPAGNNYRAQYDLARRIVSSSRVAPKTTGAAPRAQSGTNAAWGTIQGLNNKYLDFDGAYGAQCVDLFNYYNRGFVGGSFISGVYGAKDIWASRQMDQNYLRLNRSARPQMGDVVVWGASMGQGFGHVAVVVGYNPNGTIRVLQSNATPAGPRGNSIISNMSRNGVLGYFRPKKLAR